MRQNARRGIYSRLRIRARPVLVCAAKSRNARGLHLPQSQHWTDTIARRNAHAGQPSLGAFMIRDSFTATLLAAVAFLCISCSGDSAIQDKPRAAPADPSWVSSISQHSNGAISRHQPVRVLFFNDVVPEARINGDATANITITPAVKFRAVFANRREIVVRPETQFAPGTQYKVQVKATGLDGVPPESKPFEVTVNTLEVNFAVSAGGLDVEPGHEELTTLHGAINTADSESREKLEKILTATLDGKAIPIKWIGGDRSF